MASATPSATSTPKASASPGAAPKGWTQYLPSPATAVAVGAIGLSSRYSLRYAACASALLLARNFLQWKNAPKPAQPAVLSKVALFHQGVSQLFTKAVEKNIWMGKNTLSELMLQYLALHNTQRELAAVKDIESYPQYSVALRKFRILHELWKYYTANPPRVLAGDPDLVSLRTAIETLYNDISSHSASGDFLQRYEKVLADFCSFEGDKFKDAPQIQKELKSYLQIIHFYLVKPSDVDLSPLTVVFAIRKFQFELGATHVPRRENDTARIKQRARYVQLHQTLMRASNDIGSCPDFLVGLKLLNEIHSTYFLRGNSQSGDRLPTVAEFPIEEPKSVNSPSRLNQAVTCGFWMGIGYEALRHLPALCSRLFTRN